jgi:ribonuclease VapC
VIVVDTSALVAILRQEPDAALYAAALTDREPVLISAGTRLELFVTRLRSADLAAAQAAEELTATAGLQTVALDEAQLRAAQAGYVLYGRGNGAGGTLNFGDCFAYALAKTRGLPLLFKGDDFRATDIDAAL